MTPDRNMRSCVAILCSLFTALASPVALASAGDVGVVLLHGKGGSPAGYIRELAAALQGRGYLVSTPEMPWAKDRIYDASFEEAMAEIDREIDALRQKGAKLVVVAGQSLGANAALGYAASRERVGGIIALAPAHNPSPRRSPGGRGRTWSARERWSRLEKGKRSRPFPT